jgi:hypothetical protein
VGGHVGDRPRNGVQPVAVRGSSGKLHGGKQSFKVARRDGLPPPDGGDDADLGVLLGLIWRIGSSHRHSGRMPPIEAPLRRDGVVQAVGGEGGVSFMLFWFGCSAELRGESIRLDRWQMIGRMRSIRRLGRFVYEVSVMVWSTCWHWMPRLGRSRLGHGCGRWLWRSELELSAGRHGGCTLNPQHVTDLGPANSCFVRSERRLANVVSRGLEASTLPSPLGISAGVLQRSSSLRQAQEFRLGRRSLTKRSGVRLTVDLGFAHEFADPPNR